MTVSTDASSTDTDTEPNRLSLCSGRSRKPGWKTLDANPRSGADFIATLPDFPEEVHEVKWDEIELIHGIEHFGLWEAKVLLPIIRELLASGGVLVLEQPNIEYAAKVLLGLIPNPNEHKRGPLDQFHMWPLYGDPSHKTKLYSHYWGYTPLTLQRLLMECGFEQSNIIEKRAKSHFPVRDFRIEARVN